MPIFHMNGVEAEVALLWPYVCAAFLLVLLNGCLVAAELALLRVCLSHFEPELAEGLREKAYIARMIDNAEKTVRLARAGNLLCAIFFTLCLIRILGACYLALQGAAFSGYWSIAVTIVLFLFLYGIFAVIGIILPRALGLKYPRAALMLGRGPLSLLSPLKFLVIKPMRSLLELLLRVVRVKDLPGLETLGFEEQIDSDEKHLPLMARKIFKNAIEMRGLVVSDILLPRNQVQWMDLNDTPEANLKLARETGHTRFPLCDGDLDRCVGLVHIKDIFRKVRGNRRLELNRMKRDMLRISPDTTVEDALQIMMGRRQHMALVVDEFRGAEGILTLERLLELLVGDIRDEFDAEEDNIKTMPNGEYSVSGLTPVYELERELDVEFSNQEVSTVGGLVTTELGRIPLRGEHAELDGVAMVVTEVDGRRVVRLRVQKMPEPAEE